MHYVFTKPRSFSFNNNYKTFNISNHHQQLSTFLMSFLKEHHTTLNSMSTQSSTASNVVNSLTFPSFVFTLYMFFHRSSFPSHLYMFNFVSSLILAMLLVYFTFPSFLYGYYILYVSYIYMLFIDYMMFMFVTLLTTIFIMFSPQIWKI